jgi:predicted transport protein
MTNIGHYGNGDVEIAISTVEELPYVMGLVRQAYEKQMEDADSAT